MIHRIIHSKTNIKKTIKNLIYHLKTKKIIIIETVRKFQNLILKNFDTGKLFDEKRDKIFFAFKKLFMHFFFLIYFEKFIFLLYMKI